MSGRNVKDINFAHMDLFSLQAFLDRDTIVHYKRAAAYENLGSPALFSVAAVGLLDQKEQHQDDPQD